jgi:outer membrane protein OmpA-like peptidoglycan-associated protein
MKNAGNDQNHLEDDQLQVFFADLRSGKFPEQKYEETATARFYYKHLEDGRGFIIKQFNGRELFETELRAFVNLHDTGRICDVIFDSTKLREYWEPGFSGPYFIVKPYFKDLLSSERNIFQLIDFAAQEADISDAFLNAGWRDFDGNFRNDAIDVGGRLLRFDLDGAQPCWVPLRKFDPVFHGANEKEIRERIQEAFDELKSAQTEISALALRLSRLLLNNLSTPWNLANEITSAHALVPSAESKPSDEATFFTRYIGPFWKWKFSKTHRSENRDRLRRDWIDLWLNKFGNPADQPRLLKPSEVRFLGSLFYHLLRGEEPKFTLRDVYYSLILMLAGILRQCTATNEKEKINRQLNELAELKHFISTSIGKELGAAQPDSHRPSASRSLKSDVSFAGEFWGASRSKAEGWQCEDIVLDYSRSGLPMFVLADGATGAEGLAAVKIVRTVCEGFVGELSPVDSVKTARELLAHLISRIQQTLMLEGSHTGKTYETTLVIIAFCPKAKTMPTALLTRFGNSEWVATYEDQNGGLEVYNNTLRSTPPLGVRQNFFYPEKEIQQLPLSRLGIYRLRAFSDGIPKESVEERSRIMGSEDIKTLVSDAAEWDQRSRFIGDDDWSLAGFDVIVEEVSDEIVNATAPTIYQSDWLEPLLKLGPKDFPLSENALAFWMQIVRSDSHVHQLAKYPLIADLLGDLPLDTEADDVISEPIANEFLKVFSDIWRRRKPVVAAAVILTVVFSITFYFAFWFSKQGDPAENSNINSTISRPSEQVPDRRLDFKTERQNQIYSILLKGNDYEFSGLPTGSRIDDDLNKFIVDLAEVLAATPWSVIIEVHTDRTGSAQDNLLTSQRRAKAIEQLLKTNRVKESRLRVVGMGQAKPSIQTERGISDQARNRRLIIRAFVD